MYCTCMQSWSDVLRYVRVGPAVMCWRTSVECGTLIACRTIGIRKLDLYFRFLLGSDAEEPDQAEATSPVLAYRLFAGSTLRTHDLSKIMRSSIEIKVPRFLASSYHVMAREDFVNLSAPTCITCPSKKPALTLRNSLILPETEPPIPAHPSCNAQSPLYMAVLTLHEISSNTTRNLSAGSSLNERSPDTGRV
jgi:hypothetical protein